jgi:hypothetical protein
VQSVVLSVFLGVNISLDFRGIDLRLRNVEGKTQVYDPIRKKWLILTPEEHVRQYIMGYITSVLKYPFALIAAEKAIMVGSRNKRFDVVIYDRNHKPWMLIECKSPDVPVSSDTLMQLLSYQTTLQTQYWVLTNGHQTFCADATDISNIQWLSDLPEFG